MIQDHHITAWLGDALDDLDEDQRTRFGHLVREYEKVMAGRPGEAADYAEEDTAAMVAALEQVTGKLNVSARGRAYRKAKDRAYAGAVVTVLAGTSEVQAAREATITRRTLRQLLGKDAR